MASDYPRATWPRHVQALLQQSLTLRDRRDRGEISDHGVALAPGHLFNRLAALVQAPVRHVALQRFAAHLLTELPAVFGFLFAPTVDATNLRAKQALRPAAVNRKVSGGNRSRRGADAQQILASVIQTTRLRRLETRAVLVDLLRAPHPIVSRSLAAPQ